MNILFCIKVIPSTPFTKLYAVFEFYEFLHIKITIRRFDMKSLLKSRTMQSGSNKFLHHGILPKTILETLEIIKNYCFIVVNWSRWRCFHNELKRFYAILEWKHVALESSLN